MSKLVDKYCIKWIVITEAVGIIAGYSAAAVKPPLTPPDWIFPVVWTLLYARMGIGICLVLKGDDASEKWCCVNLFVAQLIVNFFWPLLFFNAQAYAFSLAWLVLLWTLVLWMTICFSKVNTAAAWLQVPYLIWLTFAAYLNAMVWLINT